MRWARNLRAHPSVDVHLESGDVVTMEGRIDRLDDGDDPVGVRVQHAYEAKYEVRHPPPFWVLRPARVFAWTDISKDPSRWVRD